ncbi:MAG: suppressor of fused domain protein [Gemmatimonadaceae bacterium]
MLNPGDPDIIESVDAHITRQVAPVDLVFHEIISPDLHIDVHWVKPARDRPFHTLVTSGMSERPMFTPAEAADFRFAELAILLDPKWPIDHARFSDENVYWPIRLLKTVARFPFEAETWVGMGHSVAAANPPEPLAPATQLSCAILLPPLSLGEGFMHMPRKDGGTTYFWNVLPLYTDELALKLEKGSDALMDALDAVGVDDVVRQERPRATGRKKFLGLF